MNVLEKPSITGSIVVAKIGGSILQKEELLDNFVADVQTLVKAGVSIAIVHGGGPNIDLKLAAINKVPSKIQGLRVTDAETLAIVVEELSAINNLIVQKLSAEGGLPALGFKPNANTLFNAEKLNLKNENGGDIDLGFVGNIVGTNLKKLLACFHQGSVPVVAPLGADNNGKIYNINADHAALAIATAFGASSLINITDVPGLLKDATDPSSLIKHITLEHAEQLFKSGAVNGGMLPKLASCIDSLKSGVKQVQIINGQMKHALLQAVTEPGLVGSVISA